MFDVLVYLFENYYDFDSKPAPDALARKLSAAGFSEDEINEAFTWLAGLREEQDALAERLQASAGSLRVYAEEEIAKLGADGIGFLAFLQNAGMLSPALRELVIDRALALADETLSLDRLKVIVLMALWSREQELDALLVEELLSEGDELAH